MRIPVRRTRGRVLLALCVSLACLPAWSATGWAASPPVVVETSVVGVSSDSVTLQAQINPEGSETSYRFEYGPSTSYGASVPVPAGVVGSGTSPVAVQVHVQSLVRATTYHFRVVAVSAGGMVDGADTQFITQPTGGALSLPDGRQWEVVSPLVKEGGRMLSFEEAGVTQASASGDAIAYLAAGPTEAEPGGNAAETQILSAHSSADGWSSRDLNTPHEAVITSLVGTGQEYRFFSPDLSLSVVEPWGEGDPPLSTKATERTMYVRDDAPLQPVTAEQTLYREAAAEAKLGSAVGYLPLVTPANVSPGIQFGEPFGRGVKFEGATADLSHIVLKSTLPLRQGASEKGLYEWFAGQLTPISILPGSSETIVAGELGGENGQVARNAISADGSRIVWRHTFDGHLYMRDMAAGVTIQLDAAQGTPEPAEARAVFQFASSDGSRVFFTDAEKLTADSTADGQSNEDLYECEVVEVAGQPQCRLSDLTVGTKAGEAAGVLGIVGGAAEDGSYLYFVARGALVPGASPGSPGTCQEESETCNLYVLHDRGNEWTTKLIATLSGSDAPDWMNNLVTMPVRVSPNGHHFAFMSLRSLTGYDNTDARSGKPDEEVYLYDADTDRLVCASCNPSGARPVGIESNSRSELINEDRVWERHQWLAADVPGWVGMSNGLARYQPRYLSDSGRLFFNSVDGLVPQATNGVADVYEYEPTAVGNCTSASASFAEASDGCVSLISGGASGEESAFLDASENGNDVFFLTSARLAPQDLDTALDVYDAHACSAIAPCPSVEVVSPPCATADSCRAAPAPQPAVFGAPASATFVGAGNPALQSPAAPTAKPQKVKAKPKAKRKHKRVRGGRSKGKGGVRTRAHRSAKRFRKSSSSLRTGR